MTDAEYYVTDAAPAIAAELIGLIDQEDPGAWDRLERAVARLAVTEPASGRQAWTAGRLDGYVAARFGSGAGSARIWVQDALAAGFTVAVYKGGDGRIDLFPYARGAVPHAAVPCSAGGLLTLVAVCYPDEAGNVVPLPFAAAGSGR